jgi:hypothetical protein
VSEANKKSGTTIVKTAPPKETARITVKPSLPSARPVSATPAVKASVPGVGASPATTPVSAPSAAKPVAKSAVVAAGSGPKVAAASGAAVVAAGAGAVAAAPIVFQEDAPKSTMVSTMLALVLAVLSWGTALLLIASYYSFI